MRLLHTSDWHLGQNFYGKSREKEHKQFLDWLLAQVVEQRVDVVIVAGDIFDTGTPPSYARQLYNQFIVQLSKQNCTLVIVAGNHDSVAMLNESKQLLAELNTYVIASVDNNLEQQLVKIVKNDKLIGIVCAIPFLRPRDISFSQINEQADDKKRRLQQHIQHHYHQVTDAAHNLTSETVPIIATGHLTALGVKSSESVRDIYIGTLDAFPASAFPVVDYIALGHIHRAQVVGKQEHIRYSGSPLNLSFDELRSQKVVNLVTFGEHKAVSINAINIPSFQSMALIKGTFEEICQHIETLLEQNIEQSMWLSVEIDSASYIDSAQEKLQSLIEHSAIEILQIKRVNKAKSNELAQEHQETLAELSVHDVFSRRLALDESMVENHELSETLTQLHNTTLEQLLAKSEQE